MGATKALAQFIVDTSYENLPASVIEAARIAILDGIVNMLAGSTQELATIIGQYVKDSGAHPNRPSSVGDSRPALLPQLSPMAFSATVWITRYKGLPPPTVPHPACPQP